MISLHFNFGKKPRSPKIPLSTEWRKAKLNKIFTITKFRTLLMQMLLQSSDKKYVTGDNVVQKLNRLQPVLDLIF